MKIKKTKKFKVNTSNITKTQFTSRKGEIKSVSSKVVKLASLYSKTQFYQRVIISALMGIIMAFVSAALVESTGLYVGGLSSFFQGTARLTRTALSVYQPQLGADKIKLIYTLMFWGQYLIVNVGLFFFAWRKIGHEFAILTLIYIATTQGVGFIFSQFVPQLSELNLLGQTATVNGQLRDMNVKSLIFNPNWFPKDGANWTGELLSREAMKGVDNGALIVSTIDNANLVRIFSLVLYACIYGIIHACCASVLFITGSSTAGSDIISVYYSQEKNVPIEKVMFVINVVGLLSGITMGSYATGLMVDPAKYCGIQYLLSGNLLCSFLWALIYSRGTNAFFPWRKLIKVEFYTNKYDEIRNHLIGLGYTHPWTVVQTEGGYAKAKGRLVITVCQVVEMPRLITCLREVDQNGMINATYIDGMDGKVSFLKQAK